MRLTCPKCSAQYEVPDDVIPEEGRDVQCSNCEETWFQAKRPDQAKPTMAPAATAGARAEKTTPTEIKAGPVAEAEPAKASGTVDPSVADILKQEAERESELRAKEGSSLESQPDLALDTAPEPAKAVPKRPAATETAEDSGQKDVLPDVDSINSSLLNDDEDKAHAAKAARKSGGFLRGFAVIAIIGVVLFLIYGNASQISEAVPQAEPALQSYVGLVDQARIWLEAQSSSASQ